MGLQRKAPFHPQWFAFFREERNLARNCATLSGAVLDVVCDDGLMPYACRMVWTKR